MWPTYQTLHEYLVHIIKFVTIQYNIMYSANNFNDQ